MALTGLILESMAESVYVLDWRVAAIWATVAEVDVAVASTL